MSPSERAAHSTSTKPLFGVPHALTLSSSTRELAKIPAFKEDVCGCSTKEPSSLLSVCGHMGNDAWLRKSRVLLGRSHTSSKPVSSRVSTSLACENKETAQMALSSGVSILVRATLRSWWPWILNTSQRGVAVEASQVGPRMSHSSNVEMGLELEGMGGLSDHALDACREDLYTGSCRGSTRTSTGSPAQRQFVLVLDSARWRPTPRTTCCPSAP